MFFVHIYHLYLAFGVVINPLPRGHCSQSDTFCHKGLKKALQGGFLTDYALMLPHPFKRCSVLFLIS